MNNLNVLHGNYSAISDPKKLIKALSFNQAHLLADKIPLNLAEDLIREASEKEREFLMFHFAHRVSSNLVNELILSGNEGVQQYIFFLCPNLTEKQLIAGYRSKYESVRISVAKRKDWRPMSYQIDLLIENKDINVLSVLLARRDVTFTNEQIDMCKRLDSSSIFANLNYHDISAQKISAAM